jgi:uncharacterized protein (TIGR01777 family)
MRVLIAGGAGFLGQKLALRLRHEGHRVQILTRRSSLSADTITWNPDGTPGGLSQHLEDADGVVNLAGETLAKWPWTKQRKRAMWESRILSTRTIAKAITSCARPPKVFISSSATGYYGPRGDEPLSESSPPGTDFLAGLCVEWEQEARAAETALTRVCVIRTGLPLSLAGGALPVLLLPFKFGAGGPVGSGRQYLPWIHLDDWIALVMWILTTDRATGAFNATAPEPITNREFARAVGRALRRPAVMPAPAFVVRLVLGDMSVLALAGQRAMPVHAEQLGFQFCHRAFAPALKDLLTASAPRAGAKGTR